MKDHTANGITQGIMSWDDRATEPGLEADPRTVEVWRDIAGERGYQVSSFGRARSFWTTEGSGPNLRRVLGENPAIIAENRGGFRYQIVHFYGGGKRGRRVGVHILVLEAFVGPRPKGMVACHAPDPTKTNNRLDNLRWGSYKDNAFDCLDCREEAGHDITAEDIPDIWEKLQKKVPVKVIAAEYGVTISAINAIRYGKAWTHVTEELAGDQWRIFPSPESSVAVRASEEILDSEEEIWCPVSGWEKYRVSSHGRVQSWGKRKKAWKTIAGTTSKGCRYPSVWLTKPGEGKRFCVHVLVLEAFVGPRPPGMVACHDDDVPTNNHVRNLRWDTRKSNAMDWVARRNPSLSLD